MSSLTEGLEEHFERNGLLRFELPELHETVRFLQDQARVLQDRITTPRPWHYIELHNPWSRAATSYDSWNFLDLCSSRALTDAIALALGPDLILYDSQWLPDPWYGQVERQDWICDTHRLPVEPQIGATVLLSIEGWGDRGYRFEYQRHSHLGTTAPAGSSYIVPKAGELLIFDARLRYRMVGMDPTAPSAAYVARYFPATSRYARHAHLQIHRTLTDLYPFLNYMQMPLWLVRGIDRAANDFVTGFNTRAGRWTKAPW